MPDAGEMTGQLPSGDRVAFVRERRHVALHRCVEIELPLLEQQGDRRGDRKSTRLNSSHSQISYAVFCLKKKITPRHDYRQATARTTTPRPGTSDGTDLQAT